MNEKGAGYTMRRVLAFALCALLLLPLASASEAGINKVIDLSGTPIATIDTPSISHDGDVFGITITLTEEAASLGTSVAWTWVGCINTGICVTPVSESLCGSNGGRQWACVMTPVDEHSYVNYKVTLSFANGNSSNYPETGFGGKIWSDCWVAGEETGGGGCSTGDGGVLPAIGLVGVLSALGLGAAVIRRD